jgi:hypothetical protein
MSAKSIRFNAAAANGPDIVDIGAFLREMEKLHDCTFKFEIGVGPGHYVGAANVSIVILTKELKTGGQVLKERLTEAFPGHKHKTLEQVMYYLCHRADVWCSRNVWHQSTF